MKLTNRVKKPQEVLNDTLQKLLRDEALGGKLLLIAAALALIAVNSPLQSIYTAFWDTNLTIGFRQFSITQDLQHWVNDGLMTFFFLVVGLEIKREVAYGELKKFSNASLPVLGAVGGMIVPAIIYLSLNAGEVGMKGWGIPVATDIAFALGVLALIGSRLPSSLRVFLLTLAIVDDLLAIGIIAFFYTTDLYPAALLAALIILGVIFLVGKYRPNTFYGIAILGLLLWVALYASGIHPTIAGALLGFMAPIKSSRTNKSVAERLEQINIPLTTFFVVPLFAFANAGLVLSTAPLTSAMTQPIVLGVILGLVIGKPLGIMATVWILTKLKVAALPKSMKWIHLLGLSLLAGIGFTVSIFITELAFESQDTLIEAAKMGIMIASLIAPIAAIIIFRIALRRASSNIN